MKSILYIILLFSFSISIAQNRYWSQESTFTPNPITGNGVYKFDLIFSGTISTSSEQNYSFSIHVNSADGTWLLDEPVALINGYNPSQDNRQFRFYMFYPDGTNRKYYYVTDTDSDENPYQYIGAKNIAAGTLSQRDIFNAQKFEDFRLHATKTSAREHRVFGPQTQYRGNIENESIKMHISNRHAPYKITPSIIGFMIGIFQDDIQKQNRYITYFENNAFKVKLNHISIEKFTVDASAYEGLDVESYNPINETTESRESREELIDRIGEQMDVITQQMQTTRDINQMMILQFEFQLITFNMQKASLNQLSQVLSSSDIARLKRKMQQIHTRSRSCSALPNYPRAQKERCNRAVNLLENNLAQEMRRLGIYPQ